MASSVCLFCNFVFFSLCIGMNSGLNPPGPYVLGTQDPYTVGIQIAGQVMCY